MKFLKDIYQHYMKSNTYEKGAALSYYTVFSFLPITMIITFILGVIYKKDVISNELNTVLKSIVGDQGAVQLEDIIRKQHLDQGNVFLTIIGIGVLVMAATGMFNQIQKSLNAIWGLKARPKKSVFSYFIRQITSILFLLIVGFILLLSTAVSSLFYKYSSNVSDGFINTHLYEHLISFFLITFLFAMLFKFIGNAIVHWKTALVSAGFTSILFFIGKIAIGLYIAHSNINSTFGAAGAIAILMIWVYYTSQILFLGASFAYVYGQKTGFEIKPKKHAVRYVQTELN